MSCLKFPQQDNGRAGFPAQVLFSRQLSKQRANVQSKKGCGDQEAKLSLPFSLPPSFPPWTLECHLPLAPPPFTSPLHKQIIPPLG